MRVTELELKLTEKSFEEDRKSVKFLKEGNLQEAHDCKIRKEAYA